MSRISASWALRWLGHVLLHSGLLRRSSGSPIPPAFTLQTLIIAAMEASLHQASLVLRYSKNSHRNLKMNSPAISKLRKYPSTT